MLSFCVDAMVSYDWLFSIVLPMVAMLFLWCAYFSVASEKRCEEYSFCGDVTLVFGVRPPFVAASDVCLVL